MKRLLIVINNLSEGGAQHMVYELAKSLDNNRYHVSILCYEKKLGTKLEEATEKIADVRYLGLNGHIGFIEVAKVYNAICAIKPDVVHAHQGAVTFASIWALIHKKPYVVTVHTKPERAFSSRNQRLIRLCAKQKRFKLVAVSEENLELLKSFYRFDGNKMIYINNGVDIDRYFHKQHKGFVLINVARHDENKNQELIIRCLNQLHKKYPFLRLILLGDGPTHKDLLQLIEELNLTNAVDVIGNVSNTEDYYAQSDLYVQSSHREAMPLSVLEAMSASLPVVSTDVGGLCDVIYENGMLVQDNDPEAYCSAIEQMICKQEQERVQMGEISRAIVKNGYSSAFMAIRYMQVYDELIERL